MDPVERENRMRDLSFNRISRELDPAYFDASDNQASILKKVFEDVERYHFHLDSDVESLAQCREALDALDKSPQDYLKIMKARSIISTIFTNYRMKNKI